MLFLIFTFTKQGALITPLTNRDHSYPSLHFAHHGGDTHVTVYLKTYCVVRTDFHAVETSHAPGIVDVPAHYLYALRAAYLLALHAVDAFVGINLDMIESVVAEASQCRPYRAYHGAESAPRQQGEDHEQQQGDYPGNNAHGDPHPQRQPYRSHPRRMKRSTDILHDVPRLYRKRHQRHSRHKAEQIDDEEMIPELNRLPIRVGTTQRTDVSA